MVVPTRRLRSRKASRDQTMTTPDEAARAVANTREFLIELLQRPRVPKEIREKAHRLLKHYPLSEMYVPLTYEQLAKLGNDTVCLWDPPKWGMSELWEASLVEFGRAVEKAHGIDAPTTGSDGCDHCRHPLYAAIKCSQCGRVTE